MFGSFNDFCNHTDIQKLHYFLACYGNEIHTGFGSPGILKSREQQLLAANNSVAIGANKNVHWSPVLVRERSRSKSPAAVDDRKVKRLSNAGNKSTAISTLWNGSSSCVDFIVYFYRY
jgi:hypothetical protein